MVAEDTRISAGQKPVAPSPGRTLRQLRTAAGVVARATATKALALAESRRPSLNDIGLVTGTDKASTIHDYLGIYESTLGHLRDTPFTMIEIGVYRGASVRMWKRFFHRAQIIGADINPECRKFESERVSIRIGDQGDPAFLEELATTDRPLVVVDDGSHRWKHQINAFRALWPSVLPGGYFIVEDVHTSFGEAYAKTHGGGSKITAYDFLAGIIEGVVAGVRAAPPTNDFEGYCRETIESVVMLRHSVIFRKKTHDQPWYELTTVADVADNAWSTDLGSTYDRIPAELVAAAAPIQQSFQKIFDAGPVTLEPAASADLRDVTVFSFGATATRDGGILAETLNCAWGTRRSSHLYRPFDERHWVVENAGPIQHVPARADGRKYVLLKQTWDRNYGHWIIDALPKVGLLEGHLDLDECVFVVNPKQEGQLRRVVLDALALAGVPADQVEFMDLSTHRFEQLVVLGIISAQPTVKAPFAIRYLERLADQVPIGGDQRLYVSRNNGTRRRLLNEEAVTDLVTAAGYRVVHPDKFSLQEQITLFRGARHVIGNLGAGLSNLAFSPMGVSVLALTTETMRHDYFYDIVCHKSGRYRGIQGHAKSAAPNNRSDFEVDLDLVTAGIEWLHAGD